jgi:hypothetical protein
VLHTVHLLRTHDLSPTPVALLQSGWLSVAAQLKVKESPIRTGYCVRISHWARDMSVPSLPVLLVLVLVVAFRVDGHVQCVALVLQPRALFSESISLCTE